MEPIVRRELAGCAALLNVGQNACSRDPMLFMLYT